MEIYLFKNGDRQLFVEAFEKAVASKRDGSVEWDVGEREIQRWGNEAIGRLAIHGGVTSVYVDAQCAGVMSEVARHLECPELVVLFQEKSFWELLLYVEQELVLKFSTAPAQWGNSSKDYVGGAKELAKIWAIPVEQIERYLVDWGLTEVWVENLQMMSPAYQKRGTKAYPQDEHEYGELYQGFDFIKALGGEVPHDPPFIVNLPQPQRDKRQSDGGTFREWLSAIRRRMI